MDNNNNDITQVPQQPQQQSYEQPQQQPYQQPQQQPQQQSYEQPQQQYNNQQSQQYQQSYGQPQSQQYQQSYGQPQSQQYQQSYGQQQYNNQQYNNQQYSDDSNTLYVGEMPSMGTMFSNVLNKVDLDYNGSCKVVLNNLRANLLCSFFGTYYMFYHRVYALPLLFMFVLNVMTSAITFLLPDSVIGSTISLILGLGSMFLLCILTTELTRSFRCRKAKKMRDQGTPEEIISEKLRPSATPVIILVIISLLLCCCICAVPTVLVSFTLI